MRGLPVPSKRLRETTCPECVQVVGVVTPPRLTAGAGTLEMRRSRHFSPQRRWCLGSGGVVATRDIDSTIGAARQAVP